MDKYRWIDIETSRRIGAEIDAQNKSEQQAWDEREKNRKKSQKALN